MHNQSNIHGLRSDKRFDALVKKQETEHQHLISCHHKEMQTMRDALKLAMEKFDSLFEKNSKEFSDYKAESTIYINLLRERLLSHESTITEQKKTIEDLHGQLLIFQDLYASNNEVQKVKKHLDDQIKEAVVSHLISIQEAHRDFKSLFYHLKEELIKTNVNLEKRYCELIHRIDENFNTTKIDREGVLKEVRIWNKAIFIIEKKIENIYTLIERLNKRGEICHKPE